MSRNLNIPAEQAVSRLLFRDEHRGENLGVDAMAEVVGVIHPVSSEVPVLFVPQ